VCSVVSLDPKRVLVLFSHPLLGEGLGRMLEGEPGISVDTVDVACPAAVEAAIAAEPAIIVLEEGGPLDAADVMRRSRCPVLLDVDITRAWAWRLRRETIASQPDELLAAIRSVLEATPVTG
jgi:hypothetical protein